MPHPRAPPVVLLPEWILNHLPHQHACHHDAVDCTNRQEGAESCVITLAHTGSHPRAVVIVHLHTHVTHLAVEGPRWSYILTRLAFLDWPFFIVDC